MAGATLTGYGGAGDSPAFESMLRRSLSAFLMGEAIRPNEQVFLAALGRAADADRRGALGD